MKKNQGHTCFACKKRENEKKENLQAWQQCSLMKHKKNCVDVLKNTTFRNIICKLVER